MRDYLTFESEFDRLKDYFLMEGVDGSDDDLKEGTNETDNDSDDSKESDESDNSDDSGDSDDKSLGDTEDGEGDVDVSGLSDLDGDSDLGDITGNPGDAPDPDKVNKEDGAPGAINPKTLLQEMAQGEDNIYIRVVNAVKEKFPNGQCKVKDLMPAIAHAVKAFMKNKNYAPLPKEAMKAVCINVAKTIRDKGVQNAAKKAEPKQESVYFVKQPRFESEDLMEGWKELAMAGAIAAAPMAHSATAPSAPYATKSPTPLFQKQEQELNRKAQSKQAVNSSSSAKKVSGTSSTVPNTPEPASVHFSDDSTYTLTPDDYVNYKLANNLPKNYTVAGGSGQSAGGIKAAPVNKPAAGKQGTAGKQGKSATQAAVKSQAKSETCKSSGNTCQKANPCQQQEDVDLGKTVHKYAHKAVDKTMEVVPSVFGGLIGAAKGFYNGANETYKAAKHSLEGDHDDMIKERGAH